uniref:Mannosyltransferase n=1 Tax=Candidozyma auris TaxID=498019 RepID=A0A0L0NWL0_CANAR
MGYLTFISVAILAIILLIPTQSSNRSKFNDASLNSILKPALNTSTWENLHLWISSRLPSKEVSNPSFLYNPGHKNQQKLSSSSFYDEAQFLKDREQIGKENATIVMLVRNLELKGALQLMRSLEDRFNKDYKYPWVFLNDVPFEQNFIDQTTMMASGKTYYELIPKEDWEMPPHIDKEKFEYNLMNSWDVIYGPSRSYRNMCHFNSGYFYRQKRLLNFEWYFRVEPDVEYMCDFQYDPFTVLRENKKVYGFVLALPDYENTIPTLWPTVEEFIRKYPQYLHPNNAYDFLTTNETDVFFGVENPTNHLYNMCHFWSNFEIANLNFFRGEAYGAYFDHLDKSGGFYYERWGDAPVHTIGLALLLDRDEIHHFEDIGYYHAPYMGCPTSEDVLMAKRCICRDKAFDGEPLKGMEVRPPSCLPRWWRYGSGKTFLNDANYTFR